MAQKNYKEKMQLNFGNSNAGSFNIFDKGQEEGRRAVPQKSVRKKVSIDKLSENELNLFSVTDDENLEELAEAIEKDGISNTIRTIPQDDGTYRIISGHRRFLAAKKAGLSEVEIWVIPAVSKLEEIAVMARENNGVRKDDPFGKALMIQLYTKELEENPNEDALPASKALGITKSLFAELNLIAGELPSEILTAGQEGLLTKDLAIELAKEKREHPTVGKQLVSQILEIVNSDVDKAEKITGIKEVLHKRKEATKPTAAPALLKTYRKVSAMLEKTSTDLPAKKAGREELEALCRSMIAQSQEILEKLGK